jgi:multisubunit Na+/H+ antiporter MnhB subunit
MQTAELVIDLLLGLAVLGIGFLLLLREDFFRTTVLFIVFGVFMSLAWVRLQAPDIALAEAAIGAGITGVLLMDAIRHMEWEQQTWGAKWPHQAEHRSRLPRLRKAATLAAAMLLMGLLLAGVWNLGEEKPGLAGAAAAAMGQLEHPVTAVLLVFRGLDTWLELGILLLAVMGMLIARGRQELTASALTPPHDPMLDGVTRVLTPVAVLCAAYLLWLGTFTAGGAFQSGVVLGAVGILLYLSARPSIETLPQWFWKLLVLLGFFVFGLAAIITLLASNWMLQYPERWKGEFIKIMEVAAAISIGACFAALFVGLHPSRGAVGRDPTEKAKDEPGAGTP